MVARAAATRHETSSRVAGRWSRVAAHHEPQLRPYAAGTRGPTTWRSRGRPCPHARRVHSSACVQGVYTGSVPGTRGLMREGGTSSYLKTPRLVRS